MPVLERGATGLHLLIHIQPGASRSEFAGQHGGALKVRVHAPPVDGKANEELVRFLAQILGIAKSKIHIIKGHKSRQKIVCIEEISEQAVRQKLGIE